MSDIFEQYYEALKKKGEAKGYKVLKVAGAGIITVGNAIVKVGGAAKLEKGILKVSGGCRIEGDLEVKELKVSGGMEAEGSIKASKVAVSGATKIKGELSCDEAIISGALTVPEVKAKIFKLAGTCTVSRKLMVKDRAEIKFSGKSYIDEIICEGNLIIEPVVEKVAILRFILVKVRRRKSWFKARRIAAKGEVKLRNVICEELVYSGKGEISNCKIKRIQIIS